MTTLEVGLVALLVKVTLIAGLVSGFQRRGWNLALRRRVLRLAVLLLALAPIVALAPMPGLIEWTASSPDRVHSVDVAASGYQLAPTAPSPTATPLAATPVAASRSAGWGEAMLLVWILGAGLGLLRLGADLFALRRVVHQAQPFEIRPPLSAARVLRGNVQVPLTCGMLRPLIVLPHAAQSWDPERLRAVLLHELSHLRRRDWPVFLLARGVRSFYWFHPLVRRTVAELHEASEMACDSDVVRAGIRPSTYARSLLLASRELEAPRAALAMARPRGLEARVRAILEPAPGAASRPGIAGWVLAALLCALLGVTVEAHPRLSIDERLGDFPSPTRPLTQPTSSVKEGNWPQPLAHPSRGSPPRPSH